jgi:hypothetical protein
MLSTLNFYDKQSLHLRPQVFSGVIWQDYVVCEKAKLFTIGNDNFFSSSFLKKNQLLNSKISNTFSL